MTTTPSLQLHLQQLLLPVILLAILAAAAEERLPMGLPDCPDMCGGISIPFPFGIGYGCFRDGFEVLCNHTSDGHRAFLADKSIVKRTGEGYESVDPAGFPSKEMKLSQSPLELVSISLATGQARTYAAIAYRCRRNDNRTFCVDQDLSFVGSLFDLSITGNILTGVGWRVDARLGSNTPSARDLSCQAQDTYPPAVNGSCERLGCCDMPFPPVEHGPGKAFGWLVTRETLYSHSYELETRPCSYAMLVEKSFYNFSTPDLRGDKTLLKNNPRGVPLLLHFAAGKTSCPAEGQPRPPGYACVSGNSSCVNATVAPGYICRCWDHYGGNPYITHGCQDIDECQIRPDVCVNGGVCKNKPGGFDCPCKLGMKNDGEGGNCVHLFTTAAKAAVGAIGGIFLIAIISFGIILHKEKKKTEEFYKKNGGPILENADVIKLFEKGDLKPILRSSNLIGKGCFGEVYKGVLDNKLVAIKKPISGSVLESEQFANEVIIQSRVIHKNIVRLIGCCLEVDAPMLVYEFISQGSLHDILHNSYNKVHLNLNTRLSIAAQSADGLAYMHSKANITILHGDVKPANILLDDNFVPKVSDFGISKLIQRDKEHTGSVIGDMNYMDPVYLQEGLLTEKSDVYSFGIVILELISGRRAIHSEKNSLVKSFLEAHKKHKKVTEFFYKDITITKDLELLDSLAGMVVECLSLDVDQRPTMMEVAERLLILGRSRNV